MTKIFLKIACIVVLACWTGCQNESAARISAKKTSAGAEAQPATFYPFWPASEKEHRTGKREIVDSKYTALHDCKVLSFETDLVEMTFDIRDVIEQFDRNFKEHPNLECDRILAERLRKESNIRARFDYSEFSEEDSHRLKFCIADLLEQGRFVIKLRSNGNLVKEITACAWSNVRGPLDGIGGRVFYLKDGRVFFWTAEWIL